MINVAVVDNKLVAKDDINTGTFLGVAFVKEDASFAPFGDAQFLSHSRVPNCKLNSYGGKLAIIPLKDIAVSEALTINFSEYGLDAIKPATKTEIDPPPVNVVFEKQEFKYTPNGYFTGQEIFDRMPKDWEPTQEDAMYQTWFKWHEQCLAGNATINEALETWWMKSIKESYEAKDHMMVTKLGWNPAMEISSKNRMHGIRRLKEMADTAVLTESTDEDGIKVFKLNWK